jgi:pimeloyl-ACP methyl ester carboxylesterase
VTSVSVGQTVVDVDGDGTPVVLVHGLGGTSNSFEALLGALGGHRCLRPDLPGSGRSALPFGTLSLDGLVEAIETVVRTLGADQAHYVGHSMGTLVCQHLAARRPELVKSLVLFGPILEPPDPARQRLRDRAALARREGMAPIADAIAAGGIASSSKLSQPLAAAFIRESHLRQSAEGFAQTCEALAGAVAADHRFIHTPTLLVTGDEDQVAPPSMARAIAERLKSAKVKILDHCGHWTPIERVQDCARLLADFLKERQYD